VTLEMVITPPDMCLKKYRQMSGLSRTSVSSEAAGGFILEQPVAAN